MKTNIYTPLVMAIMLAAGVYFGLKLQDKSPNNNFHATKYHKISEVLNYIDAQYVDEVSEDTLVDDAIKEILNDLDPHSNYFSVEEIASLHENMEGDFEGIGVEFQIYKDTILITGITPGGPSEEMGILTGDRIISVNDSILTGHKITNKEVISLLKGKGGTTVNINILRNNNTKPLTYKLTRGTIQIFSIDAAYPISDKTGYIKINRFSGKTYNEFMSNVDSLIKRHNIENLILDLRDNPGGYLAEATKLLNQLFDEKGKILVYTKDKNGRQNEYKTTGKPYFNFKNIAILINEGSASASEIVAGALQDWDKAIIIGRRTFGKGLVQQEYTLSDGSALRLTISRYYTPSGRSIQKHYHGHSDYESVHSRFTNGEIYDISKYKNEDTTTYYTSTGRPVYAKGGITPDVFIPFDSTFYNNYYYYFIGIINNYIYSRKSEFNMITQMPFEEFASNYHVNDSLLNRLIEEAKEEEDNFSAKQVLSRSKKYKNVIKAYIARAIYGKNQYFQILNNQDEFIEKAIEYIGKEKPLEEFIPASFSE